MLAGTLRGAKNVPEDWIKLFKPATLEKIVRNAGRLTDLVARKKISILKMRKEIAK